MSKKITEQDIIDSVASACQYISFYHPEDFVKGMVEAYEAEKSEAAKNVVELCTNQSIAAILPSPLFSTDYLYYNLDSRYDELRSLSTGDGGRGGLNLSIIRSLTVPFPTLIEQIAIANILSDMDSELTTLETRRDKARQLKQGMMQELLTGRIRLL